jgi:hypothetical protein
MNGTGLARLERALTRRIRRVSLLRALSHAIAGAAATVLLLEIVARAVPLPSIRTIEGAVLASGVAAALTLHALGRPSPGAWRTVADAIAPEAGVFSAATGGAAETRLSPLVVHRAGLSADALLSAPRARRPLAPATRLALAAVLAASAAVVLPGRRTPSGDLAPELQARLLAEVRAIRPSPGDSGLRDAASALDRARPLSAEEARTLAASLAADAEGRTARLRELADALGGAPLLEAAADALRREDPAALDRAIEQLLARAKDLPPRSTEALGAAARLLALAARTDDAGLKAALADAAGSLSSDGSSGDGALRGLATSLRREIRDAAAVKDVVVTLRSAAGARGTGEVASGGAPGGAGAPAPGRDAAGGLPIPAGDRTRIRPGSSDEIVLRRYFAVR